MASAPNPQSQIPDPQAAACQRHCRQFFDEYQPATPTETQLTQELADTAWRLNRIPLLEAALLDRAANPPSAQVAIDFDIVDAHRALATLGMHSERLSRQFQKTLDHLREIQAERRLRQERALTRAAALLELHKRKGIPYDPAELFSDDGFVFTKDQVEACSQRLIRLNQSRHIEHVLFHMQPPIQPPAELSPENGFVFSKDQIEACSQPQMRPNQRTSLDALTGRTKPSRPVLFHRQPPLQHEASRAAGALSAWPAPASCDSS